MKTATEWRLTNAYKKANGKFECTFEEVGTKQYKVIEVDTVWMSEDKKIEVVK